MQITMVGKENGKTEEEICLELGNPKEICLELGNPKEIANNYLLNRVNKDIQDDAKKQKK